MSMWIWVSRTRSLCHWESQRDAKGRQGGLRNVMMDGEKGTSPRPLVPIPVPVLLVETRPLRFGTLGPLRSAHSHSPFAPPA
jgi:hypothetical protein